MDMNLLGQLRCPLSETLKLILRKHCSLHGRYEFRESADVYSDRVSPERRCFDQARPSPEIRVEHVVPTFGKCLDHRPDKCGREPCRIAIEIVGETAYRLNVAGALDERCLCCIGNVA